MTLDICKKAPAIFFIVLLPLLVLFVMLFGLSFGLWTSIHRATLKSIAARHYSFEILNNRTHYIYHRDTKGATDEEQYYKKNGRRFFANVKRQENSGNLELKKEKRDLSLFDQGITKINAPGSKNSSRKPTEQVNPISIKTGYGICIDTKTCNL